MNRTIESGSRLGDRMPWRRSRFARALVFLLSQAIVLQPATVMAAASDWDVAQQPLFTVNPVHPNVVFMIDDSWSMNDYRLPPPQFLLENGRWPAAATVQVKYGVGLRTVAAQTEFTLRSYIHNPLAYDPAVTYLPWNDNDKPPAAQGTRPRRDENFPPADIGGTGATATAGRFTERDMRHVGFSNPQSNAVRKWITQARGSVGGLGSWFATSPASDRWGWNAATGRWEQPVADPKGTAIYPPLPGDGVQAADLFTNPPAVCKELAPCIETVDQVTQKCVQYENQKTGTKKTCVKYDTVPVFGNVCTETKDVFKGKVDDLTKCIDWKKESAGFVNGACIKEKDQPKTKTVCTIVQKPDPTSETGYRDYNECEEVPDGTVKVCTDWEKIEIFKDVCKKYAQKDVYEKQCTKWENQQTGTSQVCSQTIDEDVFTQVCVKNEDVITKVCTKRDPDWICPPASTVSDVMTPARYYRYEGTIPASDDDLAKTENYRLVEIDRARTVDYPVPLDPRTGDLRRRKDCKTYAPANEQEIGSTTCTRLEEMQNYANWFTYYRHRLFAAIAVTSQAAADLKGDLSAIRLGYGRINYSDGAADPWDPYGARLDAKKFPEVDKDPGPKDPHPGAVVRGVRSFTDSAKNDDRQEFFDFLFLLNWVGSTPNREAIDSIGTYYLRSGEFGPWADNPGKGGGKQGDQHASCRRSFAVLATDGEWTAIPEVKDVPPAQPLIEKRPNDPVNVGNGKNIAALATTGPQIQGAGLYANETYTYDPGKELQFSNDNFGVTNTLTDVALYWWNRDLRPGVPNAVQKRPNRGKEDSFWQNVTTYVVGYGLNASMNTQQVRQDIKDGKAINWPLVDTNPLLTTGGNRINDTFRAAMSTRGDFYSATDPDAMRNSIKGVFRAIAEQAYSGTGLASTSAQLTAGSTLYRASFTTQKWTGRLEAFDALDLANAAANQQPEPAPLWTASFPAWDQRQIYTSTANVAGGLAFDKFANLTAAQQAELGSEDVMDYVRGRQDGLELSKPIGFPLKTNGWRDRETLLGTIVSSTPLYSKAPNFAYQMKPAAGGGATYAQYVADNKAGRRAAVYVGANAGMFHAFDGNPDKAQGGGKELFAYVPRSAYRYMKELTEGDYTHRYFVDGPVVEGDVYLGGSWKTVVMGSGGAGEPGLFMLDVTKPEQFGANKVMWDITAMDEPDLGRVRGAGYIGSVKYNANGKWVALVPNGYESASNRAVLLVIDVETGQTLKKFDTCKKFDGSDIGAVAQGGRCDGSKANRNGLGSVSVVFDANRNVVAAYSGDYQGNLWKFDFSSSDPSKWKIATLDPDDGSNNTPAPLFVAKNSANVRQPISAAPRATVHPLGGFHVIFGTGKFFEYDDQTNLDIQSIYGLWDKPGNTSPIDKASTYGLELSQATDANNIVQRTLGGLANFSWQTHKGWYFDLVAKNEPATGERVVANPVIDLGYLRITSFQPSVIDDPCAGGGSSYFYSIPLGAQLNPAVGRRINGVVSSVSMLSIEAPPAGSRRDTIKKGDVEAMMQAPKYQRSNDGFTVSDQSVSCQALFGQVNVQVGSVPQQCGGFYPIRTWRPIR